MRVRCRWNNFHDNAFVCLIYDNAFQQTHIPTFYSQQIHFHNSIDFHLKLQADGRSGATNRLQLNFNERVHRFHSNRIQIFDLYAADFFRSAQFESHNFGIMLIAKAQIESFIFKSSAHTIELDWATDNGRWPFSIKCSKVIAQFWVKTITNHYRFATEWLVYKNRLLYWPLLQPFINMHKKEKERARMEYIDGICVYVFVCSMCGRIFVMQYALINRVFDYHNDWPLLFGIKRARERINLKRSQLQIFWLSVWHLFSTLKFSLFKRNSMAHYDRSLFMPLWVSFQM